MGGVPRQALLVFCALALAPVPLQGPPPAASSFAGEVARLSEPEGLFDTDNLISNERTYLEVIPALVEGGIAGGAYIGVGPDQNFSYIARIRPAVAYIIDIRRDNLLLHLLFKALFAASPTRAAYLSHLTGRAPPSAEWRDAAIERLVEHVERTPPRGPEPLRALRKELEATIDTFGLPLTPADFSTIARFHAAFIERGLALQFNSHGRPPRPHYPTLGELLLATDAAGRRWHYLASEADYQFIRGLQAADLVVPVVGDVSGPHALAAIGRAIAARGERVSAFYISNVESYLRRGDANRRFLVNLNQLPRDARSVMIRSMFGGAWSVSAVQPMDEMLAGRR